MSTSSKRTTAAEKTTALFGRHQALVGMIHVGALPGTPRHQQSIDELLIAAARDANTLSEAGFDALIVENMHDVPYLRRDVGPEIVASMSVIARAIRETIDLPLGVQVLAGANQAALAVAQAADCTFIRAEGFSYASVADEGILDEADAGNLLRYRRQISAESIAILADVCKKHSAHAITSDVSFEDHVDTLAFMGADGVVVTGTATGHPVDYDELAVATNACDLPIIAGSGANAESIATLLENADAVIVGSSAKENGHWSRPVDAANAERVVTEARRAHP